METQPEKGRTPIDSRWKALMVLTAVCLMAFPLWLQRALGKNEITGFVVIDPGHGGIDPGTRGSTGIDEKTIVLAVAKDMEPLLKRNNIRFILTRNRDKYVSLNRRVQIADRRGDCLLLSIHCDYFKQRRCQELGKENKRGRSIAPRTGPVAGEGCHLSLADN